MSTFTRYIITMPIVPKSDNECSSVQVELCGEVKQKVLEKQKELKQKGHPKPGKAIAIKKLILGK